MKVIILTLFFCITIIRSPGQCSFELLVNNPYDEQPRDGLQLDNGDYIFPVIARNDYDSNYHIKIIKISASGQVIGATQIINPNSDCFIYNTVKVGMNSFVGIGEWKETDNDSWLWYIGFDSTLSITWEKKYDIPHNWLFFIRSIVNNSGNIVSAASIADLPNLSSSELLLMEVTPSGDSIKEIVDNSGKPIVFDIIEINSAYKVIAHGYSPYSSAQVLEIDYNFNLLSIDSVPHHLGNCITAIKKNDTSYYITGNNNMHTWDWVCTLLLNLDNDIINSECTGNIDTVDYAGFDQSMAIHSPDTIFIGGTHNIDLSHVYYGEYHSWYILRSLDSMLNIRWTKYYGNSGYNTLRSIMATSDGGAILSGERYDYNYPDNKLDLYFVKVDSQGLISGTNDDRIKARNAIVYPNPGKDLLIVEAGVQVKGAEFFLVDINGKTVIHQQLSQPVTRFKTSHLAQGLYAWRIVYQNKIIESGKWVLAK